jgi:hypothetical protein
MDRTQFDARLGVSGARVERGDRIENEIVMRRRASRSSRIAAWRLTNNSTGGSVTATVLQSEIG